MRPLLGVIAGVLQYLMFAGHPILQIYPRLIDSAFGQGVFAAIVILANLATAWRYPQTAAYTTLALYLAEVALASPLVRSSAPLPELQPPDVSQGVATVLLSIAASAKGSQGLYLALTAAPASLALYLKDVVLFRNPALGLALIVAGAAALAYVTRFYRD